MYLHCTPLSNINMVCRRFSMFCVRIILYIHLKSPSPSLCSIWILCLRTIFSPSQENSTDRSGGLLWGPGLPRVILSCLWVTGNNTIYGPIIYIGKTWSYTRYIDDILIIWDGSDLQLEQFLCHCQSNPFGIEFIHVVDKQTLVFLDLEFRANSEYSYPKPNVTLSLPGPYSLRTYNTACSWPGSYAV